MFGFIVLWIVALSSIACLLALAVRYKINSLAGWLGSVLMLICAGLTDFIKIQPFGLITTIGFAIGFILFVSGIYNKAKKGDQKNNYQPGDPQAKTISDILQVAASRESLIELLNYSLDRFLEVFSLNSGAIHIYHGSKNVLVMGAYRGLVPTHANRLELIEPGQTAIGRAVQNKRVLIIRDLRVSPDYGFFGGKAEGYSFLAVAPIMVEGKCWGVITLMGRKKYQRGMLDINQLEQFGDKLGQALVLGRENRRVQAAYGHLNGIVELYNQLFSKIKKDLTYSQSWDDTRIFRTLKSCPAKLFNDRSFVILTFSSGRSRCVYIQDANGHSDGDYPDETIAAAMPARFKAGQYFKLTEADLSGLLLPGSFNGGSLTGYGYSFDYDFSGMIAVDIAEISELEKYAGDIVIIGNLLTLSYLNSIRQKTKVERPKLTDNTINEVTQELSTVFAGISGNIQLMSDQLGHNGKAVNPDDYSRWLKSVETAALKGMGLLNKIGPRHNPNIIIQSVLESENLNVAFYPGSKIPMVDTNPDEFKHTIKAILTEAVSGNRLIRLKSSPQDNSLALTIEGQVKDGFPSPDIIKLAHRNNIEINLIKRDDRLSSVAENQRVETENRPILRALTIENKPVIIELLENFFKQIGYNNHTVTTGKEGLAYIESAKSRQEPIDVAIIDMTLDDISGLELCRQLKAIDQNIYTVIISSWGVNLYKNTLDDAGVDAVLHKPFRLEQLNNVLPKKEIRDAAEN